VSAAPGQAKARGLLSRSVGQLERADGRSNDVHGLLLAVVKIHAFIPHDVENQSVQEVLKANHGRDVNFSLRDVGPSE
jgi:hypothetical protein